MNGDHNDLLYADKGLPHCVLQEEPEMARLRTVLLGKVGDLRMSAANYLETVTAIEAHEKSTLSDSLDQLVDYLKIEIVAVTPAQAKLARQAYRNYGKGYHAAKLNFGDCFASTLAKMEDAPLLSKGNDCAKTDVIMAK